MLDCVRALLGRAMKFAAALALVIPSWLAGCAASTPVSESLWRYERAANEWTIDSQAMQVRVASRANGLVAGRLRLTHGDRHVVVSGVEIRTLGDEKTEPTSVRYEGRSNILRIHHDFGDGLVVTAELELAGDDRILECRLTPTDQIEMVRNGPLDEAIEALAVDYGWLMVRPGKFDRPRLMTDFFLGRTSDGTAILIGCDQTARLAVDPQERLYSLQAMYRTTSVTYRFGLADGWRALIDAYRQVTRPSPSPRTDQIVGRLLLDDWSGTPYDYLTPAIASLRFAGLEQIAVIRHNWQHHGYDVKLPDVFPPNARFGTLSQMDSFARLCESYGVPFGLHDNFFDLYEDAPSFGDCEQAFQPSEWHNRRQRPWLGWFNRQTQQRAVRHTPASSARMMRRNLTQVCNALPVSASFLDVNSYSTPPPVETPDGQFIGPDEALQAERDMYRQAADIVGGPVLGEGCTEKFLGVVDAANCDLWDVKRWENDPGCQEWEFFPLLDWLAHDCVVLQGAGYPGRFGQVTAQNAKADCYQPPFTDDYRSASLLFGHAPLYWLTSRPVSQSLPQVAREYYLGVPFHEHVGRQPIIDVRHEADNIHRLTVEYADGTTVHVNRGDRPWDVAGWTLPRFGVVIRGQDFLQGTILWQGHKADIMRRNKLVFLDMRGVRRTWQGITTAGMLAARRRTDALEIIPLAGIDSIHLDLARLLYDPAQVAAVALIDPDGSRTPVGGPAEGSLALDASLLALPETTTPFAPAYRKVWLQLTQGPAQ